MDAAARATVAVAELSSQRDIVAGNLDDIEGIQRAFMVLMIDELNRHSDRTNAILDAIDNAANLGQLKTAIAVIQDLPQRDLPQLKAALRSKLAPISGT